MNTSDSHKGEAPSSVKAAIITVSDTLAKGTKPGREDDSGNYISDALIAAGHRVITHITVPDDAKIISSTIKKVIDEQSPDIIVTTGGTGISSRDVTIEAVTFLLDKVLDGFGEFFRRESCEKMGSAAVLSRAVAGVSNGIVIFSLPGSPDAVKTGMGIILKEACHIVKHARE